MIVYKFSVRNTNIVFGLSCTRFAFTVHTFAHLQYSFYAKFKLPTRLLLESAYLCAVRQVFSKLYWTMIAGKKEIKLSS
jgi:hypothetical protein